MEELLTELRNKVLYLRNIEELSAKGELILLHKLNTMEKQLTIHVVVVPKGTLCESCKNPKEPEAEKYCHYCNAIESI